MSYTAHYKHRQTLAAFKSRAEKLQKQDIWFPLIVDPHYVEEHKAVLKLWDAVSLTFDDFVGIVESNDGYWINTAGKWTNVFFNWGYAKGSFEVRIHKQFNGSKLSWVNLSGPEGSSRLSVDSFCTATSGVTILRNGYLPSYRDPGGFVFREARAEASEIDSGSRRRFETPTAGTKLLADFSTPMSSSASASSCPTSSSSSSSFSSSSMSLTAGRKTDMEVQTDHGLTLELNESAIVAVEKGQLEVSPQQLSLILRLFKAVAAPIPNSSLCVATVGSTLLLAAPAPRISDEEASKQVIMRRADNLQAFAGKIGAGVNSVAKWMRSDKALFAKAAPKSSVFRVQLDASLSLQLQSDLGLPHNGMRKLVRFLGKHKVPVQLSPEHQRRAVLASHRVEAYYYSNVSLEGSKNTKVQCLVYVANICEVYIQSLDTQVANGTFHFWPLHCNNGTDIHIAKFALDYGQGSDKMTVTNVNNTHPCSNRIVGVFASIEAEKVDQGKKPADSYANYEYVIPRVPGLVDFHRNSIMRYGASHVILPSHVVPDIWTRKGIDPEDLEGFYTRSYGGKSGTCVERAEVRKQLEAKSAILVFSGSKFIGVEAGTQGEATFPVREPVETAAPLAPVVPIVNGLHVHHCSDAKAMKCWTGAPGQSHCNCVQCFASAKKFKETATDPAMVLPMRTAETQLAALNKYIQLGSKKPVNGVSKAMLTDMDFNRVHPAYLHLSLGLVNDEVNAIRDEMLKLDSADPVLIAAHEAALEKAEDEERVLIAHIDGASELLGDDPLIAELITDDIGVLVEKSLDPWSRLVTALNEKSSQKFEQAHQIRDPVLPAGQVRSGRQKARDDVRAKTIYDSATTLKEAAEALTESLSAVGSARSALAEKEAALGSNAGAEGESPKGGVMYTEWTETLRWKGISVQVYWNGALVGRDCRKFLEAIMEILQRLQAKIASIHGQEKADEFFSRHWSVVQHLRVVCHLTRKVAMLTEAELGQLQVACTAWAAAFRIAYPAHATLTPKGHSVEKHINYFARRYGTCGIFGEDGLEALHPMEARARVIVRSMRNSTQRHKAMTSHLIKLQDF